MIAITTVLHRSGRLASSVRSPALLGAASRHLSLSRVNAAKNDTSTIDSFKLPSQTSINEWEFKYDFIPKTSEPKIPPVSRDAINQDIAQQKKASVEKEMLNKEHASSIKVEANSAAVVHGGESVGAEVEFLQDRGSKPISVSSHASKNTAKASKPANSDQYVQSSINPNVNQVDVHSLSENDVAHRQTHVEPGKVVDDLEHDQLHHEGQPAPKSSSNVAVTLGLLGLGAGSMWWWSNRKSSASP